MNIRRLHTWNVDYRAAKAIQEALRGQIISRGGPKNPRLIAGADVSYEKCDDRFYAAVIVMEYPQLTVVEEVTTSGQAVFPYIPGMLTFREGPMVLEAFERLKHTPDLVMFDGQGIAHPRGFGLAAHLGLLLDLPSIGCAKTRLIGEHEEPGPNAGDTAALTYEGRKIGMVVRTKARVRPLYISVGHRISLDLAAEWTLRTCRGFRIPEPTRQAHLLVNRLRVAART